MTRFLALTLAAILGAAASVAAFAPAPGAASARPSTASKTSLAYGSNYGVMDGDDQYYRGTDRYGRAGYGGYGGGYGRSGYNNDYYRGGYRTERLSDVGKVSFVHYLFTCMRSRMAHDRSGVVENAICFFSEQTAWRWRASRDSFAHFAILSASNID